VNKYKHKPVLLEEVVEGLAIKPNGIYVDGTFGRGGHARSILKLLSTQGKLIAIDKDPEAAREAKELFGNDERFHICHDSFVNIAEIAKNLDVYGNIGGILLDLGVSSPQLDEESRGFSFLHDGPLDMRMNPEVGVSAAVWISKVKAEELADVFKKYGEERYAKRIAKAVIEARNEVPIKTTKQLAEIIKVANPKWEKHKHPATRCFQAIRIFINNELAELSACLEDCLEVLAVGGRLTVVSFHSLEDRIVKRFIKKHERGDTFPAGFPVRQEELTPRLKRIGRAIMPDSKECVDNPRARSAVLRIAEKLV
jgi:16S rRNA (cytosine1402-N4)-methyltransferase